MTAIAWDGKTLAADKLCSDEWVGRTVRKIAKLRGHLVGCAGDSSLCREAMAWFGSGANVEEFPAAMRDKDNTVSLLVIAPDDGDVLLYQRGPYPIVMQDHVQAIGSGADACIAAMLCGKTAAESIEVASRICRGVGRGVDVLEF